MPPLTTCTYVKEHSRVDRLRPAPRGCLSNRELVAQRLKELRNGQGVPETLTVEWRGKPTHVEVIDMPVEVLRYNPGTHRIRAQRAYDPARDRTLAEDPWSPESQDYLHSLLKARLLTPQ